jgi:mercuric ion transport protein
METPPTAARKGFIAAVVGTVLVALCCVTPVLVVVLGAAGFGLLTPYLDYVLLPALVVMLVVTVLAYRKWRQAQEETTGRTPRHTP